MFAIEKIYKDVKEIKKALENDPELILVLEEIKRNGNGDAFNDIYDDLDNCLDDVFEALKNKTTSNFNIFLVNETQYYSKCDSYGEYVEDIAINLLINAEINAIYENKVVEE